MQAARELGKPLSEVNMIACHIGNGASMTVRRPFPGCPREDRRAVHPYTRNLLCVLHQYQESEFDVFAGANPKKSEP